MSVDRTIDYGFGDMEDTPYVSDFFSSKGVVGIAINNILFRKHPVGETEDEYGNTYVNGNFRFSLIAPYEQYKITLEEYDKKFQRPYSENGYVYKEKDNPFYTSNSARSSSDDNWNNIVNGACMPYSIK